MNVFWSVCGKTHAKKKNLIKKNTNGHAKNFVGLTADGEFERAAGGVAEMIEDVTGVGTLVVAAHVQDGDHGAFAGDLDAIAGRQLGAAVPPNERWERTG